MVYIKAAPPNVASRSCMEPDRAATRFVVAEHSGRPPATNMVLLQAWGSVRSVRDSALSWVLRVLPIALQGRVVEMDITRCPKLAAITPVS